MAAKKNEVATLENFDLATLDNDMMEAFAEEMDGLGTIPYDRVKIPSGGGLSFEVPGENEDEPEVTQELVGVIIYHHPVNAYWKDKFSGANEAPDCASSDGKTGIVRETGECRNCKTCSLNQFADDGSGKPCKNTHRIYLLREGKPIPIILTVPPTSLKYVRDYIAKGLLLKGLRSHQALTKISLKKEQSRDGIAYSRAAFTFLGKLSPEQADSTKAMGELAKAQAQTVEVNEMDYNAPPVSAPGSEFVDTEVKEELPWE